MFHSGLLDLGVLAVAFSLAVWAVERFFGTAISNFVSGLFADSPDEKRLEEWRSDILDESNRLIHVWDSGDVREYAERDEMQREFFTTCKYLDDLLAEPPRLAKKEEKRLVREVIGACDDIEEQQIKTRAGPVNLNDPDAEVETIGKTKEEIIEDFSEQGEGIASKAEELKEHIEDRQNSGLLPFR